MQNSKKGLLPFRHGIPLSNDQRPKTQEDVDMMRQVPYASVVGSLMYAILCTRPDICYSAGMVSRYQSNLGPKHWQAVKYILKYLRRTRDYMLVYCCLFTVVRISALKSYCMMLCMILCVTLCMT